MSCDTTAGAFLFSKIQLMIRTISRVRVLRLGVLLLVCMLPLTCAARSPDAAPPHHTPDGFRNVHDYAENGLWDFLTWRWQRLWKDTPEPGDHTFFLADNDPDWLRANTTHTTLTLIGHTY